MPFSFSLPHEFINVRTDFLLSIRATKRIQFNGFGKRVHGVCEALISLIFAFFSLDNAGDFFFSDCLVFLVPLYAPRFVSVCLTVIVDPKCDDDDAQ